MYMKLGELELAMTTPADRQGARVATDDSLPLDVDLLNASKRAFSRQSGGVSFQDLRDQLTWLGTRFLAAQTDVAWHHLVMAVGNFKRQAPIRVSLQFSRAANITPASVTDCRLPDDQMVTREDAATWKVLTGLSGLGVPTASTVLSALWPQRHAIVDRFALRAAVGLRAHMGMSSCVSGRQIEPRDTEGLASVSWDDYSEYRRWVLGTSEHLNVEPVDVERTLYWLQRRGTGDVATQSWQDFGGELLRVATERVNTSETAASKGTR